MSIRRTTASLAAAIALLAALPTSSADQASILSAALDAYDKAVASARENPPAAMDSYRQAAAGFESLAASGVRSAALEYNLGNTYYRLGDFGKAVLHFRRAQRLDPGDARIAANLRYARERVEPFIPPSGQTQLIDRLLFWNNNISINGRFWIGAVGSVVGWLALLAWTRVRGVGFGIVAAIGITLGLANCASVAAQLFDEQSRPHAVVTTASQKLRAGRGDAYDEVLKQPLGGGVELRVLDVRGDWVEVRLSDNVSGWLPLSAIMRV
ncbi:MAG: tetratricopeptide repeat protein [Phycisphaerae bacterium]